MIEILRREGLKIDFVTIRDMLNQVVLDELRRCDFVVDQCYSDVPLAGFASEAAASFKPAVVGRYAVDTLRCFALDPDLPVEFTVRPDDMIHAIRRPALDPALRRRAGQAACDFVCTKWSAAEVARRYIAIADDTAPEEWFVDPRQIDDWQGCGAPEHITRSYICQMVEIGSPSVLDCLANPGLRQRILTEVGRPSAAPTADGPAS